MAFNSQAAKALVKIISKTSANILLTSSHKDNFTLKEWKNIFERREINVCIIGKLPKNKNHLSKKEEILNWYNSKRPKENLIIIDDDKSLNGLLDFLKDRLIQTDTSIGLTDYLASQAIEKLERHKHEAA